MGGEGELDSKAFGLKQLEWASMLFFKAFSAPTVVSDILGFLFATVCFLYGHVMQFG